MSNFRVGQRVRIISASAYPLVLGREATIVAIGSPTQAPGGDCEIEVPGFPASTGPTGWYTSRFDGLAPLTDPKADAFIERVKKWKPEPSIVPLPVLEHIRGGA